MGGPWPSGHNITNDEARITDDLEKGKEIIVKVISEFIGGLFMCSCYTVHRNLLT